MRLPGVWNLGQLFSGKRTSGFKDLEAAYDWAKDFETRVEQRFRALTVIINGSIGIGDGSHASDADNFRGKVFQVTTAAADVEFSVAHGLGAVPVGVIVIIHPTTGFVYRSATSWTETTIYLKCSGAAQTFKILVLAPSLTL